MNSQDLDMFNPSEMYKKHEKQYELMSIWLEDFYKGYSNSDKIISLLSYWLYAFKCVLACYGIAGVKDFCQSEFGSAIRFSFLYEYGANVNIKKKKISAFILFQIAAGLIKKAYLPGAPAHSILSKVLWRITKFIAMSTPITVQKNRKQAIVMKLVNYFDGYDPSVIKKCFDSALPPVFFADQNNLFVGNILNVDCSAAAFMDFYGYENMLLFSRRLKVIGRQHGGGYDMFSDDYFSFFEKKLCDQFIGWGMSCNNERQHRYARGFSPLVYTGGTRRLIWVEHARLPLVMCPISPTVYLQYSNKRVIEYIYNELLNIESKFFSLVYPGQLKSSDYAGMRGEELSISCGKGENVICVNDVLIFDVSGASMVHYCIEHEITFIFVVSRENTIHFTEKKNEWFNVLRSSGFVFFDDEVGLLSQRLIEILSDKFELPAPVRRFHRERFIDINYSVNL